MSATLSISPFSNFLIITNILHNYILYAFLFFPFYHKLTINHQFFDIFSFPLLQNSIWAFRYIEWYKYRAKLKCQLEIDPFEWNFVSRTCLENNKSVRCQLIQLTFSNALKPVAKRIWTSDPSLRSSRYHCKYIQWLVNLSQGNPWFS